MDERPSSYGTNDDPSNDWRRLAACRDTPPGFFFPGAVKAGRPFRDNDPVAIQTEACKAICRGCPSQGACLTFALVTNQEDGVWGGMAEAERRRYRRQWLTERRRGRVA